MRRLGKVATPATAGAKAPESAAFLEMLPSVPIRSWIEPVKLVALFPSESYAVTWTGGLIALSCIVAPGGTVNASTVAGAGMTLNAPLVSGGSSGAAAVGLQPLAALASRAPAKA